MAYGSEIDDKQNISKRLSVIVTTLQFYADEASTTGLNRKTISVISSIETELEEYVDNPDLRDEDRLLIAQDLLPAAHNLAKYVP
jgi:hypothetical protein